MAGPLTGIRVVEMATVITGPYAGMLLADLGAEVVKVELPGSGDPYRLWDAEAGSIRPQFAAFNRNKQSVTLDVRKPEGQAIYRRLVQQADIVIENFRPGTLDSWGIGYSALAKNHPGLIYCAITGMGSTGPERDRPTYDAIAQAMSGLWGQFVDLDDPEPLGPPLCDQLSGLYAAYGMLSALWHRTQTGQGQYLEVSMLGAGLAFVPVAVADWTMAGRAGDKRARARRSQSYAFVAGDGKPLAIHLSSPQKFWRGLAEAVGRPDLIDDPRFHDKKGRIEHYDELHKELAALFRTRFRHEWLAQLAKYDVPAAPIQTIPEVLQHPQVQAMGLVQTFGTGEVTAQLVGSPVGFAQSPAIDRAAPPKLGEHTEVVLRRLGVSAVELSTLKALGTV